MTSPSHTHEQALNELRFRMAEIQQGLAVLINLTDWLDFRVGEVDRLLAELSGDNRLHRLQFPHLPPAQTA